MSVERALSVLHIRGRRLIQPRTDPSLPPFGRPYPKVCMVKGMTMLHVAAAFSSAEVATLLCMRGANPLARCGPGLQPLHVAGTANNEETIKGEKQKATLISTAA